MKYTMERYTHCLGRHLMEGNTGQMQWGGVEYREKHERIYRRIVPLLRIDGLFILNVSDHIRKGVVQNVSEWHIKTLGSMGMELIEDLHIPTKRNRFGQNADKRVGHEHIYTLVRKKIR